nr:hypothetical protein [Bacillus cereus]
MAKISLDMNKVNSMLKEARVNAVEAAMYPFANEAKRLVRDEDHVDTSRYINSIGYRTDYPEVNKSGKGRILPSDEDIVHVLTETADKTILESGTAVPYSIYNEGRYNILARAMDNAEGDMHEAGIAEVHKVFSK